MLHAPRSALKEIRALLPGSESPTIIPLEGRDDKVAVHAVCRENVFWETLEQLKEAGASSMLVLAGREDAVVTTSCVSQSGRTSSGERAARAARAPGARERRELRGARRRDHRARARARATRRCSTSPRSSIASSSTSLEVSDAEFAEAETRLDETQRAAIRAAAKNIETFHAPQMPVPISVDTAPGVRCERVSRPIESVGLYVPAGTAPLPSTALMLGVPARSRAARRGCSAAPCSRTDASTRPCSTPRA